MFGCNKVIKLRNNLLWNPVFCYEEVVLYLQLLLLFTFGTSHWQPRLSFYMNSCIISRVLLLTMLNSTNNYIFHSELLIIQPSTLRPMQYKRVSSAPAHKQVNCSLHHGRYFLLQTIIFQLYTTCPMSFRSSEDINQLAYTHM